MEVNPEDVKRSLEGLLRAFEAMRANAENSIYLIKQDLEKLEKGNFPASLKVKVPNLEDPNVLGIDTIGRVIKRRRLSPETIEKKRNLMKGIREQRLRDIEELKKLRAEREARDKAASVVAGGVGKRK